MKAKGGRDGTIATGAEWRIYLQERRVLYSWSGMRMKLAQTPPISSAAD